ncbi:MAG TPA: hypothetical protein VHV53_06735, partial [Solirubrobacterales bacterium]|nr:hypothetical protein [Solirubrobacterales bacterium]
IPYRYRRTGRHRSPRPAPARLDLAALPSDATAEYPAGRRFTAGAADQRRLAVADQRADPAAAHRSAAASTLTGAAPVYPRPMDLGRANQVDAAPGRAGRC